MRQPDVLAPLLGDLTSCVNVLGGSAAMAEACLRRIRLALGARLASSTTMSPCSEATWRLLWRRSE